MDKIGSIVQKRLVNKLLFSFRALKKYRETHFFSLRAFKTSRFYENFKRHFSRRTNNFSYDENVKRGGEKTKEQIILF